MDGVYNGTQGSVDRPTSRARLTPRLDEMAGRVEQFGAAGATWKELAEATGLHHGQVSGALSNLHRLGEVFVRKGWERGGCQVYIHSLYRARFQDFMCVDKPVQTRAGANRAALNAVIDAAIEVVRMGGAPITVACLDEALNKYMEGKA